MGPELGPLSAFLGRAAAAPVVWGSWDCHLWLADWVLAARAGDDPAKGFRGRYRTPLGARRLLKREGGSEALVSRLASAAGLERRAQPEPARPGDIGLIPFAGDRGFELIGGLCTGPRWAVLKRGGGLMAYPFVPSHVWSV